MGVPMQPNIATIGKRINTWEILMMTSRRTALAFLASLATILALPHVSFAADDYPSKPIRLIAPSSPGGILDITSRVVGKKLSELLKKNL